MLLTTLAATAIVTKMIHNGDRVRDDAGVRRGHRADQGARRSSASTSPRSPRRGATAALADRGCSTSIVEFLERDAELVDIAPVVADSGEGRWTAQEAIEQGVPAPVMSLALMMRFASQGKSDYADRLLAMMRKGFGGHAVAAQGRAAVIVVLMGVSGCGKTAVGQALAADLGWPFFDGDDFHPAANVAKMAAGTPLTDADRWPWLDRLAAEMAAMNARGADAVFACSALKQAYRDRFRRAGDVRFVHLKGDYDTIAARMAARTHRYMPPTLLASQFATLEEPQDAIVVDVRDAIPVQIAKIRAALQRDRGAG